MILHMDTSTSIWLTEFGFSSSDKQMSSGFARQTNYLEHALDIIQQQWPFVHVACYYEYSDQGATVRRKGFLVYSGTTRRSKGAVRCLSEK